MSTLARAVASVTVLVSVFVAVPALGSAAQGSASRFADVRQATAPFHKLDKAEAAGYEKFLPCFDSPGVGGMGQHYADLAAIDGTAVANHPEVLVYEPHQGRMQLVAVEYVIPQPLWTATQPPSLFGESFHRNDTLGIWALHAWIWRPNQNGMHADYNPRVSLC